MNARHLFRHRIAMPRSARGAALFMALMLLIVMSLLGLTAARVMSMQERMAGNYRQQNVVFQGAETEARDRERQVLQSVQRTLLNLDIASPVTEGTTPPWGSWLSGYPAGEAGVMEELDKTMGFGSLEAGSPALPDYYRISAVSVEGSSAASRAAAVAAVQTVFVP
jgi:type IV pilus assembly protein PilX